MTTPTQPAPVQPTQPSPVTNPPSAGHHGQLGKPQLSACAVTALIVGGIGVLLSWVPIVNNITPLFSVLGLIFAVIGIVATKKGGKRHGRGLAIAGAIVSILSFVLCLGTQSMYGAAIDDAVKESKGIDTSQQKDAGDSGNDAADKADKAEPKGDQDTEGDIEGAHVKIVSAVTGNNDYEGKPTVMVTYEWTNNTTKNNSFMALANAQAFQNGAELETAVYATNPQGYVSGSDLSELQPNASGTVTVGYVLADNSPVTIEVSALFSISDGSKVVRTFEL